MVTVNSVSGGKTSAYLAAHHKADYNIFALVRTNKKECIFKDKKIRQIVSDKIGKEFIGTLEMDEIVYTMLDLEQFIGSKITWVSGDSFENLLTYKQNNLLPSPLRRYCSEELKMKPIFRWWQKEINEVVEMRIGYRANEHNRVKNMQARLVNGLMAFRHSDEKSKSGRNKWQETYFQKPAWPLISLDNPIYKSNIEEFWKDKPVKFAELNNCVGCFHRNEILLKKLWTTHPDKMQFFSDLEKNRKYKNDTFKMTDDITYEKIKSWNLQAELSFDDFGECDSGHCGI